MTFSTVLNKITHLFGKDEIELVEDEDDESEDEKKFRIAFSNALQKEEMTGTKR